MSVLLDINVVLDFLLNRPPWNVEAATIWDAQHQGQINAGIAAFTVPTIFYIIRRHADLGRAQAAVNACLTTLEVFPVQRSTLEQACSFPGNDFEDNLQLACALEAKVDCIVSRDPKGFPGAIMPVLSPADLIARFSKPPIP
jgi:predicted nucleic acid-binding protein